MKKMVLLFIVSCFYLGFTSCNPETIEESLNASTCCGNEGDLPPPPPPTGD